MLGRLVTLASALSLAVGLAVVAVWVRTSRTEHTFATFEHRGHLWAAGARDGCFLLSDRPQKERERRETFSRLMERDTELLELRPRWRKAWASAASRFDGTGRLTPELRRLSDERRTVELVIHRLNRVLNDPPAPPVVHSVPCAIPASLAVVLPVLWTTLPGGRWRRRAFTALTAPSVLALAASTMLWARSYVASDGLTRSDPAVKETTSLYSSSGKLVYERTWSHGLWYERGVNYRSWRAHLSRHRPPSWFGRQTPVIDAAGVLWVRDAQLSSHDAIRCLVVVPFWVLWVFTAYLPALWLASALRCRRPGVWRSGGMCPRCGYDLRATPSRCPECGSAPASAASDRH